MGALGVPDDLELLNLFDNKEKWRFHDTNLGGHVQTARHAMALDEIRASFTVTRWANADQHLDAREVWFPGVHSDVGGGYSNTDLADGALLWMMAQARSADLVFRKDVETQLRSNPLGALHNSYKGAFAKLRSRPRNIEAFVAANHVRFDSSAIKRQQVSPITCPPYHPTHTLAVGENFSVEVYANTKWNTTGLFLSSGHKYTFAAAGEWLDSKDACDWKGTENSEYTFGDLVRATGSAFGRVEDLIKQATKNASTDYWGTKRVESYPWFSMVGAIANDSGPQSIVPNDGSPDPHQYLHMPAHETTPFVVKDPGYLFCFPNDVWGLYANNHGSVRLTVTRVG